MKQRVRPLGATAMSLATTAFATTAFATTAFATTAALVGCVDSVQVFDVALEVVVADGVAADLAQGGLGFVWRGDDGSSDGVEADAGAGFVVPASMKAIAFDVSGRDDAFTLVGLGRSPFVPVPASGTLSLPVLLAAVDRVDVFSTTPPSLGGDECVAVDEGGRVFLVGGSDDVQSGYVVGDTFLVEPRAVSSVSAGGAVGADDVAFERTPVARCGAAGGVVVAVDRCDGAGGPPVVVGFGAGERAIAADAVEGGIDRCRALLAPVAGGVWLAEGATLAFLDDAGRAGPSVAAPAGVWRALVVAGSTVVAADDDEVVVVNPDATLRRTGVVGLPVRRGDSVVVLADRALLALDGAVLRDDVDVALAPGVDGATVAASVAVLSTGTVVALTADGRTLQVSRAGQPTTTLPLPRARRVVAALPGDTVLLAGGADGVDAVAFSTP